ncbi:MAG TPA: biotin--[acetyl-CoA-carboxylase] ligase [Candidatus Omnitrophica bacterium]|nr:MAG: biotin--[acetyl-CoA-carboxylase] ligase [Omnitrophica WOR_2 bacterium GWA2_45_18]HBR14414.1 biotin--[acetyl-CoA-carboxylase] ligase [Candidatus Omnitrophota bacterium]
MQDQIIDVLKKAQGYISGEEISRPLKISRAAIWKNMQELRKEGYEIVAVPHLGYRLEAVPDKLLPREIQCGLGTRIMGREVVYYDTVTSTMDVAFHLGAQGAKEGTLICAESQSKGRGRMGRSWNSQRAKGIFMSIILRPRFSPSDVAKLTLLSAVAVCEAVKQVSGVSATIKWPNDLLVNNNKLAGILTELHAEMDRVRFVVIGIGLNVNTPLNQLPANATSLKHETQKAVSRVVLLQEILRRLDQWYIELNEKGFPPVIRRWKELSSTLGRRVRIVDQSGEVEGVAVDLDEHGGLLIRRDTGLMVKRMSGDVVQV